jgi:hypothetical protein
VIEDSPTSIELRQREDAEFERKRLRSPEFIGAELVAGQFGQAEWQRFRSSDPLAFLRARLDVQGGPTHLSIEVAWHWANPYNDFIVWARWSAPRQVACLCWQLSRRDVQDDPGFLTHSAEWMARDITRLSGAETRILDRGNLPAYMWHSDHKNDPPAERPRALPPRKRIAGPFCGTCKARFRTEELPSLLEHYRVDGVLPCGHAAVGDWEAEF